jgi:predicted HicB family RNase H-like nuclease
MNNDIIEYKGFIASLHYSHEDRCFFGKVEGIDGLITFEVDNAKDLEINFKEAIDEYLEDCKELRVEPQKSFSGKFALRLGRGLHEKA